MSAPTGRDWTGVALATLMAAAPLLPAGLAHAGFRPFAYVELVVAALIAVWAVERIGRRAAGAPPPRMPLRAWHIAIAAIAGSALYGLAAENRLDSVVFRHWVRDAGADVFQPMDHASHPLYPARVALTFVEGWAVFLLVADLCRRAPDPRRRARQAFAGWMAGVTLAALFAIAQYVTRFNLHPYWVKANPSIVRSHSTLDDPNALGACLALGIGLLIGLLRLDDRRRLVWMGLLVVAAAGLMTTMSRAAIGAAIVAPLCVLAIAPVPQVRWHYRLRTAARVLVAVMAAAVIGSSAARFSAGADRRTLPRNEMQLVVGTFDPRESADWVLRGRLRWWHAGVAMVRDHPLTGVGLGLFPRQMEAFGGGRSRENTHNLYLQLFSEAGVVGGLAFAALCAAWCVWFARAVPRAADARGGAMALGALIGLLAVLITMITGHLLLLPSGQILVASSLALAAVLAGTPERLPVRQGGRVAFVAAVAIVLSWYPTAAVVRGGPRAPGAWGYAWGLYPEERPAGGHAYRWTKGRALLDLAPPGGATKLELPVAAPQPIRDGAPTTVRVTAGGVSRELVLSTGDLHTLELPLVSSAADGSGRILVTIHVDRTFVPSRVGATSDSRELGVQLLSPRFTGDGRGDSPQ